LRLLLSSTDWYQNTLAQIKKVKSDFDKGKIGDVEARPSIFTDLLESDLPQSEKTVRRLAGEAAALIGAGTETTAWSNINLCVYWNRKPC
jgi:HEAT repeat protein